MTPTLTAITAALASGAEQATGDLALASFALVGAATACVERLRPTMMPEAADDLSLMLSTAAALLMEHAAGRQAMRRPAGSA